MDADDTEKSSISHTILTRSKQYLHNIEQKVLRRVPVWYQPKTLWKSSYRTFNNSRVLEFWWIMRTLVCEDIGVFIVVGLISVPWLRSLFLVWEIFFIFAYHTRSFPYETLQIGGKCVAQDISFLSFLRIT